MHYPHKSVPKCTGLVQLCWLVLFLKSGWLGKLPKHAVSLEGEVEKWPTPASSLPGLAWDHKASDCSVSDASSVLYTVSWSDQLCFEVGSGKPLASAGQASFFLSSCRPAG